MKKRKINKIESGRRIKESRQRAGLTQKDLADMVPLCVQQISFIENGKRGLTIENADRIGELLGVSPAYLLCIDARKELDDSTQTIIGKRKMAVPSRTHLLWDILRHADNYAQCKYKFYHDKHDASEVYIKTPNGKTLLLNYKKQKELLDDILDYTAFLIQKLENDKSVASDIPDTEIIAFDTPSDFLAALDAINKRIKEKGDDNV